MPNYLHKVEYYVHAYKVLMESHITSKCERKCEFKQDKENKRYNLPPIGVFGFNRGCYVLIVGYTIYKK